MFIKNLKPKRVQNNHIIPRNIMAAMSCGSSAVATALNAAREYVHAFARTYTHTHTRVDPTFSHSLSLLRTITTSFGYSW